MNSYLPLLFSGMLSCFVAGAFGSLISWRQQVMARIVSGIFAILGSTLGLILALSTFISNVPVILHLVLPLPLFTVSIRLDSLSAFFIGIISLITLASTVYGINYLKQYERDYNLGVFGFFYNLFILSMILVVTAFNCLYFLFVWELMSLTSLFLVVFEHNYGDTLRAGIVYFVMTHAATVFITLAFFMLFTTTGSLDFALIQAKAGQLSPLIRNSIFICFLIGFSTKAGIIPFHIWLPRAHGAAPSHVSSLMSGVMIKIGIFMMIRVFFDLLGAPPLWWGVIILLIGAASSVLGVLYALAEHDIKRLLAYHSIENIGIILLGLGSSLIFSSLGLNMFVSLALVAGLFHTLNHAVFKSLLFLGAGSVIAQTHTRNIEEYGGLIKRMPYTALFFLIGAIAISGLPPFNGFASEWLTYQNLFQGITQQSIGIKSVFIIGISSLAITGGLAAACFVKAFGITFLARPRSEESKKARESGNFMVIAMGFLAILCLLLGLGASFVMTQLTYVAGSLALFAQQIAPVTTTTVSLNLPLISLGLGVALAIVYGLTYLVSRRQKVTTNITWGCGFSYVTPRMEITATGFAALLL